MIVSPTFSPKDALTSQREQLSHKHKFKALKAMHGIYQIKITNESIPIYAPLYSSTEDI
jgi:hypothetical protein